MSDELPPDLYRVSDASGPIYADPRVVRKEVYYVFVAEGEEGGHSGGETSFARTFVTRDEAEAYLLGVFDVRDATDFKLRVLTHSEYVKLNKGQAEEGPKGKSHALNSMYVCGGCGGLVDIKSVCGECEYCTACCCCY